MKTLGIETSCDETAIAIVEDGKKILCNVIATQEDLHQIYGGVFPELASRRHREVILPLIDKALSQANCTPADIDLIAVTKGPGLIGSLNIGISAAKSLSLAWQKPLIGVNHVEAHIYASIMSLDSEPQFPSLGVVLSGGHTCIFLLESPTKYRLISTTVDDAIGEAFDKIAKLLSLPYPGGPQIEKLAKLGDEQAYAFKAGLVKQNPLYFSFSGLKTNVLYAVKGQNGQISDRTEIGATEKQNIAASFQKCAIHDIIRKTLKAAEIHGVKAIYMGGGVTQNQYLRQKLNEQSPTEIYWPGLDLCLDNAAMIAGFGSRMYEEKFDLEGLSLKAYPRIAFN